MPPPTTSPASGSVVALFQRAADSALASLLQSIIFCVSCGVPWLLPPSPPPATSLLAACRGSSPARLAAASPNLSTVCQAASAAFLFEFPVLDT
jgi:hypothetical protein